MIFGQGARLCESVAQHSSNRCSCCLRTNCRTSTYWLRELKLDGYRAVAFKSAGKAHLRSRNDNDFNLRYPAIAQALARLPDGNRHRRGGGTPSDEFGRPSFNILQNYGSSKVPVIYCIFDLMVLEGQRRDGQTPRFPVRVARTSRPANGGGANLLLPGTAGQRC